MPRGGAHNTKRKTMTRTIKEIKEKIDLGWNMKQLVEWTTNHRKAIKEFITENKEENLLEKLRENGAGGLGEKKRRNLTLGDLSPEKQREVYNLKECGGSYFQLAIRMRLREAEAREIWESIIPE